MVTTAELVFWIAALVIGITLGLWVANQPTDLEYEGRKDKIGGKGGR